MKKTVVSLAVLAVFAGFSTSVFAAASQQGCQSSGGQAAGCDGAEVQPMPVPPPFQGGNNTAVGVGVGVGIGQGGSAESSSSSSATGGSASVGDVSGGNVVNNIQVGDSNDDGTRSVRSVSQETVDVQYSGSYELKNVPNAYAPSLGATSPCMGSTSLGGSGVGFGFSAGTTWHDKDCTIRETARSFAGMGMNHDAMAILCSSDYAAAAPSCTQFKEDQIAARESGGVTGVSGERPSTGFRYAPQTGERLCAYDEFLASRNNLMVCPR